MNYHGLSHELTLSLTITRSLIVSIIIVCTSTLTCTYRSATNSGFTALAVPSTCFLAATVEENGAGFTGVSEISRVRFPSLARRVPIPSPCIELWDILLDSSCLIPVEAGLQQCSFNVLNQCSMGGRQVLERLGTIREKVMSSFIYAAGTTTLAVHDDNHTLQSLDMDVIVVLFRVRGEGNQGFCEIWCCLPSCPCTLFPMAQEC